MKFHEHANKLPLIEGKEFDELVGDINKHGLQEKTVYTLNGKILDGRNRFRACERLGITKQINFTEFKGTKQEALIFVLSLNLYRRQLTSYQKIELVDLSLASEKAEAAKKRKMGLRQGSSRLVSTTLNRESKPIDIKNKIAKLTKTSSKTVSKVRKIRSDGTEDQKKRARSGKSSISAVYKEIKSSDTPLTKPINSTQIQQLEHTIQQKDTQIQQLEHTIQQKDTQIQQLEQTIKKLQETIEEYEDDDVYYTDEDEENIQIQQLEHTIKQSKQNTEEEEYDWYDTDEEEQSSDDMLLSSYDEASTNGINTFNNEHEESNPGM